MNFPHLLIKASIFIIMDLWPPIPSLVFINQLLLLLVFQASIELFFHFLGHFAKNVPNYLKKTKN